MQVYLKNDPAKFHPDPVCNDGPLGFFGERRPNNKMSGDIDQLLIQKAYK